MKTDTALNKLETRAAEALKTLLGQVSAIKLTELTHQASAAGHGTELLAQVDVYGHNHTLTCEIESDVAPEHLRQSLRGLRDGDATPLVIAQHLSPEAQAVCKQNHAGFLDLEGNARLTLGELFIGTQQHRPTAPARNDA
jgi:hypothetical protein